jgi:exopolysaccharide biosynthesis protein
MKVLYEGFRDPKIVALRGRRSIVGLTRDDGVFLAVVDRATIAEGAVVAERLGAVEAMNLDDNASSGLVCDGRYLVQPGRKIADALVVWDRPR